MNLPQEVKKILQLTFNNYVIEKSVFDNINTIHLCISSQIGYTIGCKICYTEIKNYYHRNLSSGKIISQVKNIINKFNLR